MVEPKALHPVDIGEVVVVFGLRVLGVSSACGGSHACAWTASDAAGVVFSELPFVKH